MSVDELIQISEKVFTRQDFRPNWLDVMTAPRIRPRHLDINLPGV